MGAGRVRGTEGTEAQAVTIYGLVDPETFEVRYIGRTINLKSRLKGHSASDAANKAKREWVADLKGRSLKPSAVVLEVCGDILAAGDAEEKWVDLGRQLGWRLLSGSGRRGNSGGTGIPRQPGDTDYRYWRNRYKGLKQLRAERAAEKKT